MTSLRARYYFGNISYLICCLHWRFHQRPGDRVVHLCRLYQTHHYSQTKDCSFAASVKWPENREPNLNPPREYISKPVIQALSPRATQNTQSIHTPYTLELRLSTRCSVVGASKKHVECCFTSSKSVGPKTPASCQPPPPCSRLLFALTLHTIAIHSQFLCRKSLALGMFQKGERVLSRSVLIRSPSAVFFPLARRRTRSHLSLCLVAKWQIITKIQPHCGCFWP